MRQTYIALLLAFSLIHLQARAINLDEALGSALKKNVSIHVAREKVTQAEEKLSQAKSAPQPNLALNATYFRQPELNDPLYRQFSPREQTTANLTLTQPLFRGFREFAILRQRQNYVDAERAGRQKTIGEVFEKVATAYYEVLALEQDLRNLADQRRLYAERVKNLVSRARRGESPQHEPLAAQSAEAVIEAETQVVHSKLKAARENFAILSNLPAESELKDINPEDSGLTKVESLNYYLKRLAARPDIRAAESNAQAAGEQVRFARGSHWPSLDAVGNYYLKRPDGFQQDLKWDLQLKLNFPIYEGGLRMAETREAESRKRQADIELAHLRRTAEAELATLHETALSRVKHLEALKRATEFARKNSQELERNYRRGLARNIDVQSALADFGVTRRNFDQARYAARLDIVRLDRAANILPQTVQKFAESFEE